MFKSGGFEPTTWLPAGLVLLGLLVAAGIGGGTLLPAGRWLRRGLALLGAYTAWNYLSISWAAAPGDALDASNLLLLAGLSTWTLALAPWRAASTTTLMLAFSTMAGLACIVSLLSAMGADDLTSRFTDFRWNPPLDYPNTTAAFAFMAAIGPLVMAARRELPVAVRAYALGLAALLSTFALLPQSRGSVLGVTAALLLLLAIGPRRWAVTLRIVACAAIVVVLSGPVLDVYTVATATGKPSGALGPALRSVLLAGVLGLVVGALAALADDRLRLDDARRRQTRLAGFAALGLVVLAVIGVGAAKWDGISSSVSDNWRSLKHPGIAFGTGEDADQGGARFTDADPLERYDYWRVAMLGFRDHPFGGTGAGGFAHLYALERRYPKPSKYPHNLAMKALGDTGIVGFLLAAAVAVAFAFGLVRNRGHVPEPERMACAAAVACGGYFLAHGMFDWLEAYPVLLGPPLGFAAAALRARDRAARLAALDERAAAPQHAAAALFANVTPRPSRSRRRTPYGKPLAGVAVVGAVLAFLSLGSSWLSERYLKQGAATWRVDADAAYTALDRSASTNRWSPEPLTLKGVIALTRGDRGVARAAFRRSLTREEDYLPHLGLALLASADGDLDEAARQGRRARALDRLDPNLPDVLARVTRKQTKDPFKELQTALTSPYVTRDDLS